MSCDNGDRQRLYLQSFDNFVDSRPSFCDSFTHLFIDPMDEKSTDQSVVLSFPEEELQQEIDGQ